MSVCPIHLLAIADRETRAVVPRAGGHHPQHHHLNWIRFRRRQRFCCPFWTARSASAVSSISNRSATTALWRSGIMFGRPPSPPIFSRLIGGFLCLAMTEPNEDQCAICADWPPALRPAMRRAINDVRLRDDTSVCDGCLVAFWYNTWERCDDRRER
jgi:hypothetical protein